MKKHLILFFLLAFTMPAIAKHITGGEVNYKYLGPGATANSKRYRITLKIFRDNSCSGCAGMPASVTLGIYNNDNNQTAQPNIAVPITNTNPLSIVASPTCLDNPPSINYSVGFFNTDVDLLSNGAGYSIVYQTCCRIDGIANAGNSLGSTFLGTVPGANTLSIGTDNSATFENGISIICFGQPFVLNFSATDEDGDVLQYSLVDAFDGGAASDANFNDPAPPPFSPIQYTNGYSGLQCLGPQATINSSTGIISGIAPGAGKYVVCVAVKSFRNGVFISETRKDFIVTVAPCTSVSATLKPTYTFCDFGAGNQLTYSFANEGSSPLNLTFNWSFGDPTSGANNTSTNEFPSHTYTAPGDYVLTLVVNQGTSCERTATSVVKVYPGFFPNIAPIDPQCRNVPVSFIENGTTNHGVIDFWKWDFGITNLSNDTSRIRNATYTYPDAGMYNVSLIVKNSKGCVDTLFKQITITENANLIISRDTLICSVDTIQLRSNFNVGTITWSPSSMIIGSANSFNPLVSPDVTTTYTATYLSPTGCSATKNVTVRVVNEVTLLALVDTTICRGDTIRINTNTDALYFNWTPASLILNPTIRNPQIFPTLPITDFFVKASISNKCFKEGTVRVTTVPYPVANITGPSRICYGQDAQLSASGGSIYAWTPASFLNNPNIPNPISVKPFSSISYTVRVTDVLGCPKPVFKTFPLEVIKVNVNAGPADTSIVLNQPLLLNGTSNATIFSWTPGTDLSVTDILNPISNTANDITYTLTATNNIGCSGSDSIKVKVFNLPPDIYVPSAFTPDGDVKNDVIRPIALGIKKLEYFSIYNRFGELLFRTSDIGRGWDGTYKGQKQLPATYVWQAEAIDYKDKRVFKKGTVILIR
jgi:gliding motility-associated-like protein